MLGRTYDDQVCSIARTLEVIGERWTLLIIRDAFRGLRRFDEFQASLGVARNVLTDRLNHLVQAGILERVPYQERPRRYDYYLTDEGRDLGTALLALMHWGDRHLADEAGPPVLVTHAGCGGDVVDQLVCGGCGAEVGPDDSRLQAGPGAAA